MSTELHPAESTISTHDLSQELRAILTGAAFAPLNDVGWLRVAGPDATRWLNGMVTNSVQSLAPGEGCYNFLLNAQGRILGDCTIYRDPSPEPAAFLLRTDSSQIDVIHAHLEKFIIMDDVELARVGDFLSALVLGPSAPQAVSDWYPEIDLSLLEPLRLVIASRTGDQITTPPGTLVPSFEVRSMNRDEYLVTLNRIGVVSPAALEAFRILSGTPRYGVDIRNTEKVHDLPQETAQERALHFAKGCYLGQEIVERIRSRGSVHRTFTGFVLTGELPPAGTELTTESAQRPVGELTSVVALPRAALDPAAGPDARPFQIALGYIRREALDRNLPVTYPGGTAAPASLPFKLP